MRCPDFAGRDLRNSLTLPSPSMRERDIYSRAATASNGNLCHRFSEKGIHRLGGVYVCHWSGRSLLSASSASYSAQQ